MKNRIVNQENERESLPFEEKPKVSFSKEENKPLLQNEEAASICIDILQGRYHGEDFEVDELFLEHYKEVKGKDNPTQEEINQYIADIVKECEGADGSKDVVKVDASLLPKYGLPMPEEEKEN